jgi:gliding motility-associated-like protein
VVIPSGFSPNDDLKNDTWEIKNLDQFTDIKVSVYNRWGSLLFLTEDPYTYWDGDEIPVGTYYYIIEYDGYEGRVQLTGPITIIR